MAKYIVRFEKKENPAARLFCVPFAGGTAAFYRSWAPLLPSEVELCAVEIPGRLYTNDKAAENMDQLVDILFPQVVEYIDKPFAIYGHSFGSVIAYELVKRLQKENKPLPTGLFVSSRRAPQQQTRFKPTEPLTDQEFITEMQNKFHAIPVAILHEKELLKLLLPILRSDMQLNESYVGNLEPLLRVPVTAFYGEEDNVIQFDEMKKWKAVTTGPFHIEGFPGGHFFIEKEKEKLISIMIKI